MRRSGAPYQIMAILALSLSGCTTVQTKAIPGGDAIVVQAPTFRVGDEWHFSGGVYPGVIRVVSIEADEVVSEFVGYTLCESCRYFRDRNLTTTKVLQRDGLPWPDAVIGIRFLEFPLQVGREWTQEISMRSVTGQTFPYRNRFRVEAYEEIQVKAGTFKAFRIAQFQENLQTRETGVATSWWSPDVRWWVRFEPLRGTGLTSGGSARVIELESYVLK